MLCQLHRYFGKSIKCYLVSKNPCSNTGHLLGWAKTEIHMQKRWDTSILGLDEAFWIPGSWVLINYSFSCRNKTGIKEASMHTKHFSLTRMGLPSFQGPSRASGHEEWWIRNRETLFNVIFRGGDAQERRQPFLRPSQPELRRLRGSRVAAPKGSRLMTLLDHQTRIIRERYSFIPVMDLIKSAHGNKIKCM